LHFSNDWWCWTYFMSLLAIEEGSIYVLCPFFTRAGCENSWHILNINLLCQLLRGGGRVGGVCWNQSLSALANSCINFLCATGVL
jgi:hypothetical protein